MKLLVLYSRLSGYMTACLREFRQATNTELLTIALPAQADAPFNNVSFDEIGEIRLRTDFDSESLLQLAMNYQPDALLVSGWADSTYVKVCRRLKQQGIPIIAGCDTQWTGSLRQRIAGLTSPWYVQKFIDVLWVTGERQQKLASRLGYRDNRCWDGFYVCDREKFSKPEEAIDLGGESSEFLFVGRYVPEKGLHTLSLAYKNYRRQVSDPWPLICAGSGPFERTLVEAGAELKGFVQPKHLPELMWKSSCFILPSKFEPWGVVVQEAAAAGLPLILSNACGAGDHLLKPGQNGFLFTAGDADQLTDCMVRTHNLSSRDIAQYGHLSVQLSEQYSPEVWAAKLHDGICRLRAAKSVGK